MKKIVECVPNLSTSNKNIIKAIVASIKKVKDVKLLDYSADPDHNRLVVTFIGDPPSVEEAAFSSAAAAVSLINLKYHKGVHPRIGAVDVIPFIPVRGVTMRDCIRLSHKVGEEVAEKLGVPVFMYGKAAKLIERVHLSHIRRGGFELLEERIKHFHPDYGEKVPHKTAGAVAIGARDFLIAFNVNLKSKNLDVAKDIASKIRKMPGIQALGIELKTRKLVQVSINIVDYKKTSIKEVFDAVKLETEKINIKIDSSEIIGLIPKAASFPDMKKHLKLRGFDKNKILETHL